MMTTVELDLCTNILESRWTTINRLSHQQKLKKVRQEELLREAGLTATPNNLRKLQHYVTNYELINDRKIVVSDVVLAKLRKMSKKK